MRRNLVVGRFSGRMSSFSAGVVNPNCLPKSITIIYLLETTVGAESASDSPSKWWLKQSSLLKGPKYTHIRNKSLDTKKTMLNHI